MIYFSNHVVSFINHILKKLETKYLLTISIILACFIGYDASISDTLALLLTIFLSLKILKKPINIMKTIKLKEKD